MQEAGGRRQEAGGRRQEAGGRRQEFTFERMRWQPVMPASRTAKNASLLCDVTRPSSRSEVANKATLINLALDLMCSASRGADSMISSRRTSSDLVSDDTAGAGADDDADVDADDDAEDATAADDADARDTAGAASLNGRATTLPCILPSPSAAVLIFFNACSTCRSASRFLSSADAVVPDAKPRTSLSACGAQSDMMGCGISVLRFQSLGVNLQTTQGHTSV